MRFSNGFFGENEATLGMLRFSAMRREVFEENADGTPSDVVKERTYDLKSDKQGRMIQVSVPASVPVRDFAYNAEVKLVNPMFGAIAHVTFGATAPRWIGTSRRTIWCSKRPHRTASRTRMFRQIRNRNAQAV